MKLSFPLSKDSSKPSKPTIPSSSSDNESPTNKQFITEFYPSKTLTDSNSNSNKPIIIPPISNQWTPQNQSNHLNLQFETHPNSTVESVESNIANGLNLRDKKQCNQSRIDRLMLMKLKSDLKRLPNDNGLNEFNDVPVDKFAPAYLKGYGWYKGRGIGKNAKEDVKVVQFTKRTGTQGLGFVGHDRKIVKSKKGVGNCGKGVAFCERE